MYSICNKNQGMWLQQSDRYTLALEKDQQNKMKQMQPLNCAEEFKTLIFLTFVLKF